MCDAYVWCVVECGGGLRRWGRAGTADEGGCTHPPSSSHRNCSDRPVQPHIALLRDSVAW